MTKLTKNKLIITGSEKDIQLFHRNNIIVKTEWIPYSYNFNLYDDCLIIKFNSSELPMSWLVNITKKNTSLIFKLWYGKENHNLSSHLVYKNGVEIESKITDYNSYVKYEWCDMCHNFVFEEEPGMLNSNCLQCQLIAITNYFFKSDLKEVTQNLACMRIGRNPITQTYLLRKIFIPRMSEILI